MPVALIEPRLLSLSYAVATALLVVVEALRLSKRVLTIGQTLDSFYGVFVDAREQDSRVRVGSTSNTGSNQVLILTPIYLLIGCAVPHWLYWMMAWQTPLDGPGSGKEEEEPDMAPLLAFAGILSVGVGDAAAAAVGSTFGRYRWPGSRSRTLEGSAALFCGMLGAFFVLASWMHPRTLNAVQDQLMDGRLFGSLVYICLLEAYTTQIDNLVLPVFMSTLIVMTW